MAPSAGDLPSAACWWVTAPASPMAATSVPSSAASRLPACTAGSRSSAPSPATWSASASACVSAGRIGTAARHPRQPTM